jgi:hypothetical protein
MPQARLSQGDTSWVLVELVSVRYEDLSAAHGCKAPEYYIAADVRDKNPRPKLAIDWERFDGSEGELVWGELRNSSGRGSAGTAT